MKIIKQEAIKQFIYELESRLAYYNSDDYFTKDEIFFEIKDLAKESFDIDFNKEQK